MKLHSEEESLKSESGLTEAEFIADIGNWDWDLVSGKLSWSKGLCSIFGITPDEFGSKYESFLDFLPPDERERTNENVEKAVKGIKPLDYEHRIIRPDGSERIIHARAKVTFDKEGKAIRMLGTAHDITERKQADEKLRMSEELYRAVVESAFTGISTADDKENITYSNPAFAKMLGFSQKELTGMNLAQIMDPAEFTKIQKMTRLRKEGKRNSYELILRHKDGTPINVLVSGSPLTTAEGSYKETLAVIIDISERKRAEEALQVSEERFRNIAEETDDWVWEIGQDLLFKYSNERVKEILGYEPEEIVGRSFIDFMSIEEFDRVVPEEKYRMLKDKIFTGQETYMLHKNGKTVITESSGVPVFRRNRTFVGFQGLTRDITERVQAKQEEEKRRQQLIQADKMISLGILISGVAHEINNPNQFIIVNAPLLKRAWEVVTPILDKYYEENGDFRLAGISYTEMRDRIPALFSEIYKGSQRIKHIVQSLKDYAREDSTDITREVNVNDVLKSALIILANLLKKSTEKLVVNYAKDLPPINGNFQRIEQVLINLIQNACQALPDPTKAVIITTYHDKKKRKVLVKIRDEGVGIPEENMKYIIDPFFTSKRNSGGTGLGLSISAGIIEDHGGRLEFSSEPGKVTTVTASFPVIRQRKSQSAKNY